VKVKDFFACLLNKIEKLCLSCVGGYGGIGVRNFSGKAFSWDIYLRLGLKQKPCFATAQFFHTNAPMRF